jgi:hypothetical protein
VYACYVCARTAVAHNGTSHARRSKCRAAPGSLAGQAAYLDANTRKMACMPLSCLVTLRHGPGEQFTGRPVEADSATHRLTDDRGHCELAYFGARVQQTLGGRTNLHRVEAADRSDAVSARTRDKADGPSLLKDVVPRRHGRAWLPVRVLLDPFLILIGCSMDGEGIVVH